MASIRAVLRGLEVLRVLNLRNGATVTEVARATGLPRTTANRVLDTLVDAGYVVRDAVDGLYRPGILVRSLSHGFQDEVWVREVGQPLMEQLTEEVVWPVSIASPSGTSMLVRGTTDRNSPLALIRYSAGYRLPIMASASGHLYMAHCDPRQRTTLVSMFSHSDEDHNLITRDEGRLNMMLERIREQKFATYQAPGAKTASLAVPIWRKGEFLAALTLRHMASAMTSVQAAKKFTPRLHEVAEQISSGVDKLVLETQQETSPLSVDDITGEEQAG